MSAAPTFSSSYSVKAQNGSAYSQNAYQTDTAQPSYPASSHATNMAHSHYPAGIPCSGSAVNERSSRRRRTDLSRRRHRSPSSTAYQTQAYDTSVGSENSSEYPYNSQYQTASDTYYLTQNSTYPPEDVYDRELQIEEEQAWPPASEYQHPSSSYSSRQQASTPSGGYYAPQNRHDQQSLYYRQTPAPASYSHTTNRWSSEYSPEERLRLGLPRWQSEEDRAAYELGRRA